MFNELVKDRHCPWSTVEQYSLAVVSEVTFEA